MNFCANDLRQLVIKSTLKYLGDWSEAAENLLVGTAIQESESGRDLKSGAYLGLYHISPSAHRAVWDHYLIHHPEKASRVRGLAGQHSFLDAPHEELITNLKYATAIAWSIYQKAARPLPDANDIAGLAEFWHLYFHTKPSASRDEFVKHYQHRGEHPEPRENIAA